MNDANTTIIDALETANLATIAAAINDSAYGVNHPWGAVVNDWSGWDDENQVETYTEGCFVGIDGNDCCDLIITVTDGRVHTLQDGCAAAVYDIARIAAMVDDAREEFMAGA